MENQNDRKVFQQRVDSVLAQLSELSVIKRDS